jgi:hypothetical protein
MKGKREVFLTPSGTVPPREVLAINGYRAEKKERK